MTAIVIPYTFVAGTTARANEVNDNNTAITAVVNGNIDNSNISASAGIALSKLALTTELAILRSTGNRCVSAGITGDTVPRASLTSDGWHAWGAGSASAMDTMLKRTAAAQLSLRNFADNAYADLLLGALTASGAGAFTGNLSGAKITASGTILAGTTVETLSGICGFRLSVATGDPVGSGSASGSLYLVPYGPNAGRIAFYDGTNFQLKYYSSQATLSVSMTSGLPYDIFAYDNAGTLTLDAVAWTNTTTRATGLATVNNIYVKSGATSRLYVGTVYASGSNQVTDNSSIRGVFNMYNRVSRTLLAYDTTDSWTYNSATWRAFNNSSTYGTARVGFVVGLGSVAVAQLVVHAMATYGGGAANLNGPGIGIDAVNALAAGCINGYATAAAATYVAHQTADLSYEVPLGFHFASAIESGSAANYTYYGDAGSPTLLQSGLVGGIVL